MTSKKDDNRSWYAREAMPTLDVGDIEEAIAFYVSIGFKEEWRWPDPGPAESSHGVPGNTEPNWTHAGVRFGNVRFMLAVHDCNDPIQRQNIYIFIDGVDAYHDSLKANIQARIEDLVNSDYGMRDFSITDPWGHRLSIGEPV